MTWTILGGNHTCPTCNAAPGTPCTSRNGKPLSNGHAARFRDQQTDTCKSCGQPIVPGFSATGWVHESSRRARCDGQLIASAGRSTAPQAQAPAHTTTPPALDEIRSAYHDDQHLASDAQFEAFLAGVSTADVLRDRLPRTAIELRHLARARKEAAA